MVTLIKVRVVVFGRRSVSTSSIKVPLVTPETVEVHEPLGGVPLG